jgi:hypothetical protein
LDPAVITANPTINVSVDVKTALGNKPKFWSNAIVIFDYQSPTNYKFAGLFQGRDELIIGQVKNGKSKYLKSQTFVTAADEVHRINVAINRSTSTVTLTSPGGPTVVYTYSGGISTGPYGVGTLNANSQFDNLVIS